MITKPYSSMMFISFTFKKKKKRKKCSHGENKPRAASVFIAVFTIVSAVKKRVC